MVEKYYRHSSHTLTNLQIHIVWVTKYRYKVLRWEIQERCRDVVKQTCEAMDIDILKWVMSSDHIHVLLEYPPKRGISEIIKRLKGRSSRILQKEFSELGKRYWGQHMWAVGYFAVSIWNMTEDMVQEYLEHHKNGSKYSKNTFILEDNI